MINFSQVQMAVPIPSGYLQKSRAEEIFTRHACLFPVATASVLRISKEYKISTTTPLLIFVLETVFVRRCSEGVVDRIRECE